jgi:hypothetical protein
VLVKSAYSLNGINFIAPYAYTEWDYSANRLTASRYYVKQGGAYPLYSNSTYETNDSGMVTVVNQFRNGNIQRNRFEYDDRFNLRKTYLKFNSDPETLFEEFFDYDSIPNPFFRLPFEFDYDMYMYGLNRLSKNNYRRHILGSNDETFALTYYPEGRLETSIESSNPFPAISKVKFIWGCR